MLYCSAALVDAPRMDDKAMRKRSVSQAPAECSSVLRERCVLPSDTFLEKGSANLDKLKDLCNDGKERPSTLFQLYTQVFVTDIKLPLKKMRVGSGRRFGVKKEGGAERQLDYLGVCGERL